MIPDDAYVILDFSRYQYVYKIRPDHHSVSNRYAGICFVEFHLPKYLKARALKKLQKPHLTSPQHTITPSLRPLFHPLNNFGGPLKPSGMGAIVIFNTGRYNRIL